MIICANDRCDNEIVGRRVGAIYCSDKCAGRVKQRTYTAKQKAVMRVQWRNYFYTERGTVTALLNNARSRAKAAAVPMTLTRDFVETKLAIGVCEMTGIKLVRIPREEHEHRTHPYAPSLDRIVPHLGYVPENVRMVCFAVNQARSDFGDDVLYAIAQALIDQRNR